MEDKCRSLSFDKLVHRFLSRTVIFSLSCAIDMMLITSSLNSSAGLKFTINNHSLFITHGDFNIADPSGMQDAHHPYSIIMTQLATSPS